MNEQEINTSSVASFRVVFQGIPGISEPQTIEMKIPKAQNPKEPGLSITYEEYSFPMAE